MHSLWSVTHTETKRHFNAAILGAQARSLNKKPQMCSDSSCLLLCWMGILRHTWPSHYPLVALKVLEYKGNCREGAAALFRGYGRSLLFMLGPGESPSTPTPAAVNVSESVTSCWALHRFHFLPGHGEIFTLGLSLGVSVHAFRSLCILCVYCVLMFPHLFRFFSLRTYGARVSWDKLSMQHTHTLFENMELFSTKSPPTSHQRL